MKRMAHLPPRLLLAPTIVLAACSLMFVAPGEAGAIVSDVHAVDGPSADVVNVEDAAMSEDGTGGIVYLKRSEGHTHVFAVQFHGGWGRPQRVDVGQTFDSSWARIGAGDGGRLVVTWVQEFGVESDRMFSATLDPGASGFQLPVPIDFNVGEATSTYPDLAMNRGGQAYLVYRVVTDVSTANPPGYLGADVRVARYNGRLWSVLGTPVDRSIGTPVRQPTESNSPRVGIDVQGGGMVAWQEPDDEFVDRIWARRLFGASFGIPLQVSPSSWEGAPLRGAADAFSLDVSGFGQVAVAFRQLPGQSSRLTAPRVFVNEAPDVFSEKSGSFGSAHLADGGALGELGVPSVGVDPRGLYLAGFGSGPATLAGTGDDVAAAKVFRLDTGASSVAGDPLVDVAETGAAVSAWGEQRGEAGDVGIQERRADGVVEPTVLSASGGGGVGRLVMGGSGLGDAIVAWKQGDEENGQVAVAVVDAPPDPFLVLLPEGWQRKRKVRIAWDPAHNAIGGVRYSVSVDDEPVVEDLHGTGVSLTPDEIEDGRHRIQVFAVDDGGQETGSRTGPLQIDRTAPEVKLRRRGRRLTVMVTDGPRRSTSGLRRGSVAVSFGDGTKVGGSGGGGDGGGGGGVISAGGKGKPAKPVVFRKLHAFERSGRYRLVVRAKDKAGNVTRFARGVKVR